MKTKYQIYFQDDKDIQFNWFEADSKLEKSLSKHFKILNIGSKKCKGKKLDPKKYLLKVLGKRPVYTKRDNPRYMDNTARCSMLYTSPITKEMIELSQMLWDKHKKEIDKLIKLL